MEGFEFGGFGSGLRASGTNVTYMTYMTYKTYVAILSVAGEGRNTG